MTRLEGLNDRCVRHPYWAALGVSGGAFVILAIVVVPFGFVGERGMVDVLGLALLGAASIAIALCLLAALRQMIRARE